MVIAIQLPNCPNWKQPKYPAVGEWKDKLWYFEKETTIDTCNSMSEPQRLTECKKPLSKGYILYNPIYNDILKKAIDREQISVCKESEVGGECEYKGINQ